MDKYRLLALYSTYSHYMQSYELFKRMQKTVCRYKEFLRKIVMFVTLALALALAFF